MMWGPAVARAAADVALTGRSDVVDADRLGLDRFDADGRSRLATDPIALPFPEHRRRQAPGQAPQAAPFRRSPARPDGPEKGPRR